MKLEASSSCLARSLGKIKVVLSFLAAIYVPLAGAEPLQMDLELADSGNLYLHGHLDQSVATSMLVDTGSGYVSLSRKTFRQIKRLPGTEYLRDIHGTLANGRTLRVPIYRVRELALGENCILTDIEVAVFPGADRDILGLNALRRVQPFTLQLDPPALIANCNQVRG